MELTEFAAPIGRSILVEEVDKDGRSRPHFAYEILISVLSVLNKDSHLLSLIE